MKLAVFALDFDGTIAHDDVLQPAVRSAIGEARSRGILVALATGRRVDDLRRVADLSCFDVVVAENGAVLEFPANARHVNLARPPVRAFVDDVRRSGVPIAVGESVVEAPADAAPQVLAAIRRLELPLTMSFNRSRLMVLPPAVAKSTGLRSALHALRASPHNTLAVGDAENDHDLLDACEVGAAVEWGSPALCAAADEVIRGPKDTAVADYLRRVMRQPRLSAAQMGRHRMVLGREHSGEPVSLAVRGRTILVAGEPGTGKSWLAGLICEQLILQGYSVCVIDPEGDYRSLEELPGVTLLGGDDPPPGPRELARALEHPDVSVVIDLSKMLHREKIEYVNTLLPLLIVLRRRTGLPHKILLDEAHYFLSGTAHTRLIDPELAGYIVVTFRISALDPALRAAGDTVALVTRESDPGEAQALSRLCCPESSVDGARTILRDLQTGEAALLAGAEEARGEIRRFRMLPRLTAHVRHRAKYVDMPVADAHAFVFSERGAPATRARTLKEFVDLLGREPARRLEGHLARHDFSRWLGDVFRDHALATHVRRLESRAATEDPQMVAMGIAQSIRARYESGAIDGPGDRQPEAPG